MTADTSAEVQKLRNEAAIAYSWANGLSIVDAAVSYRYHCEHYMNKLTGTQRLNHVRSAGKITNGLESHCVPRMEKEHVVVALPRPFSSSFGCGRHY